MDCNATFHAPKAWDALTPAEIDAKLSKSEANFAEGRFHTQAEVDRMMEKH